MEKNFKPVPNVDCLKYKGTSEKPDIKIFVSHRIDLNSETIDNPLYIPVRCGATFDERSEEEIGGMLGDDTGDNISEKRKSFCELTVLYWAWKNVEADYYGLCHYRRYLSFSEEQYKVNKYIYSWGCVHEDFLREDTIQKYSLNEDEMIPQISQYDIVIPSPCKLDETDGPWNSNREYIEAHINSFNSEDIELLRNILTEKSPQFLKYYDDYFNYGYANWYNCFIVKRKIFKDFCAWVFPILFEFEKRIDSHNYSRNKSREPGFFGEHLWGVYLRYIREKNYHIAEKQLVFFKNTDKQLIGSKETANEIPIVFACSELFIPYAAIALSAIINHSSPEKKYKVIFLNKGFSTVSIGRLKTIVEGYDNFVLMFYNPYHILPNQSFHVLPNGAIESYYKLFIPWVLKDYDKAIVLDSDIIVKCDIADLFEYELDDNWIAATKDILQIGKLSVSKKHISEYYTDRLKCDVDDIFEVGVMIMNLKSIRKEINMQSLVDYCCHIPWVNQEADVINSFMKGKIMTLEQKWDFIPKANYQAHFDMLCSPLRLVEDYENSADEIKIIHYKGETKPWILPQVEYGDLFWMEARKTIYYEIVLQRMINNLVVAQISNINKLSIHPTAVSSVNYISGARRVANHLLPIGSKRREFLKKIMPKGSPLWNFFKKIYDLRNIRKNNKKPYIIG